MLELRLQNSCREVIGIQYCHVFNIWKNVGVNMIFVLQLAKTYEISTFNYHEEISCCPFLFFYRNLHKISYNYYYYFPNTIKLVEILLLGNTVFLFDIYLLQVPKLHCLLYLEGSWAASCWCEIVLVKRWECIEFFELALARVNGR